MKENKTLREFMMRSRIAYPQSEEDINHYQDGLDDNDMKHFFKQAGLKVNDQTIPNENWDEMSVAKPKFVTRKPYKI